MAITKIYKFLGLTCWLMGFSFAVSSQSVAPLEIIKADTVFSIDSTHWNIYPENLVFGGISGMERLDDGRLLLISDRQVPGKLDENQYSWAFVLNPENNKIEFTYRFFGMKNIESVRSYNNTAWFSFEDESQTGVGFIDTDGYPVVKAQYSMTNSPHTMDNRGIEGIAVGNDLWFAFESSVDITHIVKWPELNPENETWFSYPLDKRSCLTSEQPLNGNLGNGISEILDIPGENDKLLVMERCFNGKFAFIKIFEAKVINAGFEKTELFDWTPETQFNNKSIKPDNMEGMTWGETEQNGKRTLYIISDDNQNPLRQRTILLKLREK